MIRGRIPIPRTSGGGLGAFGLAPGAMSAAGQGMGSVITYGKRIQAWADEDDEAAFGYDGVGE